MGGIGKSILKWLAPGEITRYLGFPFGLRIPQQQKRWENAQPAQETFI